MNNAENHYPVFYDPAGKRERRLRRAWLALATVISLLAAVFIASVCVNPLLPRLQLRAIAGLPKASDIKLTPPPPVTNRREAKAQRVQAALRRAAALAAQKQSAKAAPAQAVNKTANLAANNAAKPLAIGFYVNWDDSSYASLKRHIGQLDWIVPEWIRLQRGDHPAAGEIDLHALDLIRRERGQAPIIPMIHNSKDGVWDAPTLVEAIKSDDSRKRLIDDLAQFVASNNFQGVCIDFEEVPDASQTNLLKFMRELHHVFSGRNWIVAQAAPFDDPAWNYRAYAEASDYLMLMAYDEHWNDSEPGSVAGQPWFEATMAKRMRELDGAKTIICIGGYGYDWSPGKETSEVTFQEAVLSARDSEAQIKFDQDSLNPFFRYEDEDGSRHTVWFLDAVSAYNQMRASLAYRPFGFALWRMGSEDPSLWSVFGQNRMNDAPDALREIKYGYDVDFEGVGEVLQIEAQPVTGARAVTVDPASNLINDETYTTIPSSYVIRRVGNRPGMIALTFDDGPDAQWTPRILEILKREHVPATFFIIGQNGQTDPQLVKRIVAEGHDIGNHSFTHPNMGEIPGRVVDLELNATQRLIESLTGRSTRLFRAPYFGDAEPTTPDEVEPAARAERLGYVTVGLHVDPDDWARPGADSIVKRTIEGVTDPDPDYRGQIVLLHDGGGDRSQTVEALPRVIHELRARGYGFMTVSEMAGLTRDQAMPPIKSDSSLFARADAVTFYAVSISGWLLRWVFVIGIVLGLSRIIFIGALALAQRLRARKRELNHAGSDYRPFVSVIVPAYNEERVIAKTVGSLLASDYPNFEIIVVDDGSSDRTSDVAREAFGCEPRVRLFAKENGGKAEALNFGLRRAKGEIIVALDADTVFPPGTVGALVRRFADPQTGAVAGNAKVGNRINVVTRWQALEYVTAQNLDRRAFASLNCITVVPGAVGAWRRDLLEKAGGFTSDTLAEDQDLTLKVRRLGYNIGYEEDAIAWTEAPDTLGGLAKQRFRWSFGTLQCMWKHRGALFNPRYGALGFVAMPNVWIFQILFPLISPVMDLMFVWSLISAGLERLEHPGEYAITNLGQVMFYYALFLAVDWLAAAFAFLLEKREQWRLLWWLFPQRFCYRQVMYYVMVKSALTALRGVIVGWGKLERRATVEAPDY